MNTYNKCHARRSSIVAMMRMYPEATPERDHPESVFVRAMVQPLYIALKRRETALYPP